MFMLRQVAEYVPDTLQQRILISFAYSFINLKASINVPFVPNVPYNCAILLISIGLFVSPKSDVPRRHIVLPYIDNLSLINVSISNFESDIHIFFLSINKFWLFYQEF